MKANHKKITLILILIFSTILMCTLTACNKNHEHSASSMWQYDESGHWHICTDCSEKLDYASHEWDNGVVTLQPTLESDGEMSFTCAICHATKKETVSYQDIHKASEEWVYNGIDGQYHWHACSGCDEHVFDKGEHTFVDKSNDDMRWKECSVCGLIKEQMTTVTFCGMNLIDDRTFDVALNATIGPPTASVDGYSFEGWYTSNSFSEDSRFDFATEISKNLTLYANFVLIENGHEKEYQWNSDDDYHWHDCVMKCDRHQYDKGAHDFSVEKSEGNATWIECSVCGRRMTNPYAELTYYDGEQEITELNTNILYGHSVDRIPSTEKDGCVFVGWYEDSELTTLFDFSKAIYADTSLYAKFAEILQENAQAVHENLYITDCAVDVAFSLTSPIELNTSNLAEYVDIQSLNSVLPAFQITRSGNACVIKPANGERYCYGATYNFTLKNDEVFFTEYGENVRSLDFSIIGPENDIKYNPNIKYISLSLVDKIDDGIFFINGNEHEIEVDDILCLWNGKLDEDTIFLKVSQTAPALNSFDSSYGTYVAAVEPELEEIYEDLSFSVVEDVDVEMVLKALNTDALVARVRNSKQILDIANTLANSIAKSSTVNKIYSAADRYFDDKITPSPNPTTVTIKPGSMLPGFAQKSLAAELLKGLTITAKNGKKATNRNFRMFSDKPWIQQTVEIAFDATINRVKISAKLTIDLYLYVFLLGYTVEDNFGITNDTMDISVNVASQTSVELLVMCCSTSEPDTKVDITKELQDLFEEDGTINNNLIAKVQKMMDEDGDYIDLLELNFVHLPFSIFYVVNIDIDASFVVSVNFAAGLTGGVTVLDTQTVGFRGSIRHGFNSYSASPINHYGIESEKTRYEIWAAAYGYVGLRAGIRLEISIYLVGLKDLGNLYAQAEAGVYADLYGYLDFYYLQPATGSVVKSLKGALYFEVGVYVNIKIGAESDWFNAKAEADLLDLKFPLLSLGNKYTIVSAENSDVPVLLTGSKGTSILDDYTVQVLDITTGEMTWVSIRDSNAIVTAWFGDYYVEEYNGLTYRWKDVAENYFTLNNDTGEVSFSKPTDNVGVWFHDAFGQRSVISNVTLACSTKMHVTLTMKGATGDGNSLSFDVPVYWVEEGETFDYDFSKLGQMFNVEYAIQYYDYEGNFEREEVVFSFNQYSTEKIRGYYVKHYGADYDVIEDYDYSSVGTQIESDLYFVQKLRRRATTVGFAYSLDYTTVNIEPVIYELNTAGIALPEDIVAELNDMPTFNGFSLYIVLHPEDGEEHVLAFYEKIPDVYNYAITMGLYGMDTHVEFDSEIVQRIKNGEYDTTFDFGSFYSLLTYNLRNNINNDDIDLRYYIVADFDEVGVKKSVEFVIPEFNYSIVDVNYGGTVSTEKHITTAAYYGMDLDFEVIGQYLVYTYGSHQDTLESQIEKQLPFGTEIIGWSLTEGGEKICDKYGSLGILDGNKTFYAIIDYKAIPFQIVDHNHEATEKTFKYYDWVGLSDADVPELVSLDGVSVTADTNADDTVVMICTGYTLAYGEKKREIGSDYNSKFTVVESGVITPIYERAYKLVVNLNGGKVKNEYIGKDMDDNPDTFTIFLPEGEHSAEFLMNFFERDRDDAMGIFYENAGIAYCGNKVDGGINVTKSVNVDMLYNAISNLFIKSEYSTIVNVYNALQTAGYDVQITGDNKEVSLRVKPLEEVLAAINAVKALSVDTPTIQEDSIVREFKGMWADKNGISGFFLDAVYEADILSYTVIADSTAEARFDDGKTIRSDFYAIGTDLNTVLFRHEWTDNFHLSVFFYATDYYKEFYGWELPDGTILRNCANEELKNGEVNTYVINQPVTLNVTAKYVEINKIKYRLRFMSNYGFEGIEGTEVVLEGYYGESVTNIPTPKTSGLVDMTWGVPMFAGWNIDVPEKFGHNRDLDGKGELLYPTDEDVYGQTIIRAVFTYRSVPVQYYINGELYEIIEHKHGDTLAFPTVKVPNGKNFFGWYTFAGNSLPIYKVSETQTVNGSFSYNYYGFMIDESDTFEVRYYVPDLWLEDEYKLLFIDDANFSVIDDIDSYELCFEPFGYTWVEKYLYVDGDYNIYMEVTAEFSDEEREAVMPTHAEENHTDETQSIKFYVDGQLYQVVETNDMNDFYRPEIEIPEGKVFVGWFWRVDGGPFSVLPEEIDFDYDFSILNNSIYGFVEDENAKFYAVITRWEYNSDIDDFDKTTQRIEESFADFDSFETILRSSFKDSSLYIKYRMTNEGELYAAVDVYYLE